MGGAKLFVFSWPLEGMRGKTKQRKVLRAIQQYRTATTRLRAAIKGKREGETDEGTPAKAEVRRRAKGSKTASTTLLDTSK